jgi:hypothetical protein
MGPFTCTHTLHIHTHTHTHTQTPALDVDAEITRRKDADAEALAATQLAAAQKEAAEAKAQGRTVRPAVAASVGALFEGDVRPSRAVSMQVEQKRQRAKQEKDARAQSAAFMIEGYVHKRSLGLIRLWQKRYMMLDAHSMLIKYFRSEKDRYRAPIGTVPVHYIRRAEPATSGRLGGKFKIVTDTRTFELRAVDNATALNWIEQVCVCACVCGFTCIIVGMCVGELLVCASLWSFCCFCLCQPHSLLTTRTFALTQITTTHTPDPLVHTSVCARAAGELQPCKCSCWQY